MLRPNERPNGGVNGAVARHVHADLVTCVVGEPDHGVEVCQLLLVGAPGDRQAAAAAAGVLPAHPSGLVGRHAVGEELDPCNVKPSRPVRGRRERVEMFLDVAKTRGRRRAEHEQHRRPQGEIFPTGPRAEALQESLARCASLECVSTWTERRVGDRRDSFGVHEIPHTVQRPIEVQVCEGW